MNFLWKRKLEKLNSNRELLTQDGFVFLMSEEEGYNKKAVECVHDSLKSYLPKDEGFSIYPEDDIVDDYGVDEEDMEDMVVSIFNYLKADLPEVKEQFNFYKKYGETFTVRRMVQFVDKYATEPPI